MAHAFMFKRDMFVWVDETGNDHRTHIRKFGCSLRGISVQLRPGLKNLAQRPMQGL